MLLTSIVYFDMYTQWMNTRDELDRNWQLEGTIVEYCVGIWVFIIIRCILI